LRAYRLKILRFPSRMLDITFRLRLRLRYLWRVG
jgi:hypothetical protein